MLETIQPELTGARHAVIHRVPPKPGLDHAPGDVSADRFVDDYLYYLLSRAAHLVSQQFHAQLRPRGMAVPVWRVLATLSDSDGLPVTELARRTLFKQPTLTKVIDRMERQGLVERRASEQDRRKVLIYVTERGRNGVGDLLERAKRHEQTMLAGYGDNQVALLKTALHDLIERCGG
jgi:MarR family transcriptional regulator, organic hydroperoxide resistance regulator